MNILTWTFIQFSFWTMRGSFSNVRGNIPGMLPCPLGLDRSAIRAGPVMLERSFEEEYIKHHKSTFAAETKNYGTTTEKKTCIVFSNRVPTNNCGPGTFQLCKCGRKMNTEGRVSFLLLIFTPFKTFSHFFYIFCWRFLLKIVIFQLSDSITLEQGQNFRNRHTLPSTKS